MNLVISPVTVPCARAEGACHAHGSRRLRFHLFQRFARGLGLGHHRAAMLVKDASRLGRREFSRASLQEPRADLFLERRDAPA